MNTASSPSQFLDLPDEILLIILTKLNTTDVFKLNGLNKRIDNIIYDEVIASNLTLFKYSSHDGICELDNQLLDLFCLKILPDIHYKIQSLNVELSSIELVFCAVSYPNLYKLGLYNMNENIYFFFKIYNSFFNTYKKQITSLIVMFNNKTQRLLTYSLPVIFKSIFEMFTNLDHLSFTPNLSDEQISFEVSSPTNIVCGNLLKLNINVNNFNDCLHVLDGRFQNLRTLYIRISRIDSDGTIINNKETLCNLKYFSLSSDNSTNVYNELVIPLLHRMLYLEKLRLHLTIVHKETFIDSNNLKTNIINHLLNLKKFIFNLHSFIPVENGYDLPSNENIQQTLKNIGNNSAFCCIDYYPYSRMGHCHIYSHLRLNDINCYLNITNNFPGGIFEFVKKISLFDEQPFEHVFLIKYLIHFHL